MTEGPSGHGWADFDGDQCTVAACVGHVLRPIRIAMLRARRSIRALSAPGVFHIPETIRGALRRVSSEYGGPLTQNKMRSLVKTQLSKTQDHEGLCSPIARRRHTVGELE